MGIYIFLSILILGVTITGSKVLLLLTVLFCIGVVIISDSERNLNLLMFLVPCLGIFALSEESVSYATVIYLCSLLKHIYNIRNKGRFNKLYMGMLISLIGIEIIHIFSYDSSIYLSLIRWIGLFIYPNLILLDRSFKPNYEELLDSGFYGCITSFICGVLILRSTEVFNDSVLRIEGVAGDPNGFALILLIVALGLLNIYRIKGTRDSIIKATILIILGFTTLSRTYILIIVIILIFYSAYSLVNLKKRYLKLIGFLFLFTVIFSLIFSDSIKEISEGVLSRIEKTDITNGRFDLFKFYLCEYYNSGIYNVLFGAGLLNYMNYYGATLGSHNTFIEVLISWGIVGTILLIVNLRIIYISEKVKNIKNGISIFDYLPMIAMILYLCTLQSLAKYSTYFLIILCIKSVFYSSNEIQSKLVESSGEAYE